MSEWPLPNPITCWLLPMLFFCFSSGFQLQSYVDKLHFSVITGFQGFVAYVEESLIHGIRNLIARLFHLLWGLVLDVNVPPFALF